MSNSARNSKWANAGVVVSIEPEDVPEEYAKDGAFALMNFQRDVEKKMFDFVHENYPDANPLAAPAQRMVDFCEEEISDTLPETSYHPGAVSAPLHELLPKNVAERLQQAFPSVNMHGMRGYYTNDGGDTEYVYRKFFFDMNLKLRTSSYRPVYNVLYDIRFYLTSTEENEKSGMVSEDFYFAKHHLLE